MVRHGRPRIKRPIRSFNYVIPIDVQVVRRNVDLFRFIFDHQVLITSIHLNIGELDEGITPFIRVILNKGDTVITKTIELKLGDNVIKFDEFTHKDSVLKMDFKNIDSVYLGIRKVMGNIRIRG